MSEKLQNTGRISSFESLGGRDGPGLRFVVFMQGCPLRCICCHNPETWEITGGQEYSVEDVMAKIRRCRPYFGPRGGVTVSGGEPLLQQAFVTNLLSKCKAEGIRTALDTSGALMNDLTVNLLNQCDLVLLDIKYTNETDYQKHTLGSLEQTLKFLSLCDHLNKEVVIRHVVIPGINETQEDIVRLKGLCKPYACITGIELLPFSNLCREKYQQLGIAFALKDCPNLESDKLAKLKEALV